MKTGYPTRRIARGNPFARERRHDPYHARTKLREATSCPQCGVRYRNGRWTWPGRQTSVFKSALCPACRRINDDYPAGEVVLSGPFLAAHRDQILATVRHAGDTESNEHPLNRIMSIDDRGPEIRITTTDIHLPHRIAHAVRRAFAGTTRTHYDVEGYFTRVHWQRDD